ALVRRLRECRHDDACVRLAGFRRAARAGARKQLDQIFEKIAGGNLARAEQLARARPERLDHVGGEAESSDAFLPTAARFAPAKPLRPAAEMLDELSETG